MILIMKNLLNQRGFSLVQGMILAGVVAGSSLVATRMLTDQKKAQKGAETRDLVEELHNVVYSTLQNRNHCKQTIMSAGIQAAVGNPSNNNSSYPQLNRIQAAGASDYVIEENKAYMNNSVKVASITLGPIDPIKNMRNLEITYERLNSRDSNVSTRTKDGYGAKSLKKTVWVRMQKEPMSPNTFSSCYAVTADVDALNGQDSAEKGNDIAKELCQEMNTGAGIKAFIWDETLSICKPNGQCPGDQVFTGVDTNGTVKCRNLNEWIDMANILDSTPPTGCGPGKKIRLAVDNTAKKVRLECY